MVGLLFECSRLKASQRAAILSHINAVQSTCEPSARAACLSAILLESFGCLSRRAGGKQSPAALSFLSAGSRKAGGPFSHSLQSKQLLESPVLGFRAGPRSLPWSLAVNEEAVSYVGQTGS